MTCLTCCSARPSCPRVGAARPPCDEGSGGACDAAHTNRKVSAAVTPDEPIAHRRCRLLTLASELGEVAEVGQQMGISRTRSGEGKRRSGHDGLAALPPTARRTPQLRNATPTHVTHELLSRCVFEPTLGCRELADRLGERGAQVGTTTVRTLRNAHGLGR